MFLIRAAFWLSVVVILLPADPETGDKAPRVSAFEAIGAAEAAVADASQFCTRNPDVCVTGGAAFQVFGEKVRYGARMVYGFFGEHGANGAADKPPQGTLTPEDVQPQWHSPEKPDGAV